MSKKILDFQANITDVKQINPLFSTCKVRVLYTGRNRNMSIIDKEAVTKALPTIVGIPIVGEYSEENKDFKGHGGAISMDDYRFIHTTKPYGFVPESATYEWEEVRGKEYLTIDGCYLWTGRYEEALSVIENGKGQSMEIEVTNGAWDEEQDAYRIDNFIFSALCILGDDVEPAFEDANIRAYSLDKDSFKQEFTKMLEELKSSIKENDKEVDGMLKDLLEKYSTTMEELTAKGLDFNNISEDEIEAKIVEVLGFEQEPQAQEPQATEPTAEEPVEPQATEPVEPQAEEPVATEPKEPTAEEPVEPQEPQAEEPVVTEEPVAVEEIETLKGKISELESAISEKDAELEALREFKLEIEKSNHEAKVQELFTNFQLTEEDVKDIEIHSFSVEEIEEKCFAILGRKLASKKFSLEDKSNGGIKVPVDFSKKEDEEDDLYGGLFKKFSEK